ncbi:hypothetical protein [Pseudonocardia sp. 73-21]|nr:hypothetical protein [Pseudonocardia sp. 73-21]
MRAASSSPAWASQANPRHNARRWPGSPISTSPTTTGSSMHWRGATWS